MYSEVRGVSYCKLIKLLKTPTFNLKLCLNIIYIINFSYNTVILNSVLHDFTLVLFQWCMYTVYFLSKHTFIVAAKCFNL